MQAVTKEVTFDCAHMLSGYEGLCKNLHGHTYKLQVTVVGPVDDKTQMIVDFNDLKATITEVVDRFDHATIISGEIFRGPAEDELLRVLKLYGLKIVELPAWCRSTCEDMSKYLHYMFSQVFGKNHIKIRLWETPTSFAEAE